VAGGKSYLLARYSRDTGPAVAIATARALSPTADSSAAWTTGTISESIFSSTLGGLLTIVISPSCPITECFQRCQFHVLQVRYWLSLVPASFPVNPPRRPPRPRGAAPGCGSAEAGLGASRLPCRAAGLSTAVVGGSGSRSESWSEVLPKIWLVNYTHFATGITEKVPKSS